MSRPALVIFAVIAVCLEESSSVYRRRETSDWFGISSPAVRARMNWMAQFAGFETRGRRHTLRVQDADQRTTARQFDQRLHCAG